MDGHLYAGNESPPSRTTILGSFLRGRPRNSSQSHIQVNTDLHPPFRDLSPSAIPPQPPSPNAISARRRTIAPSSVVASSTLQSQNPSAGLNITNMLRRRRSAGNVAQSVGTSAPTPPMISASATAAAALGMPPTSTNNSNTPRPTAPPMPTAAANVTLAATTLGPSPGQAFKIRLVPHLDTRRSLRFEAIGRDLKEGDPALRIGRFTDRSGLGLAAVNALGTNKLAFRSKVVSRAHAEIWVEAGGKFFVKDTKSSSGTFLNHVRLSAANTESKPFQIKDGDILQLGVDYQGGAEDIYKSVKIRIEIGREWQASANAFNTNALRNLKSLALPAPVSNGKQTVKLPATGKSQIPDCCICLFAVTIRQALFIAPCSHTFHFKCIRPLIEAHHPAFSCPLCRTFADLEEDVEVDIEYEEEGDIDADADAEEVEAGLGDGKNLNHVHGHQDPNVESPPGSDPGHGPAPVSRLVGGGGLQNPHSQIMEFSMDLDNLPASRSNSGLGLRGGPEAGAETEVEGEGSNAALAGRPRRTGGRPIPGAADRGSPLLDFADEHDEHELLDNMVVDMSHSVGEMGMNVAACGAGEVEGGIVDLDGNTVSGKRKR